MQYTAVLSSPTANKIYALGDGAGGVCDFGTVDVTGVKMILRDGLIFLQKTAQFTNLKMIDGDPILITSGTGILPGVYTAHRVDDDNCVLMENALDSIPMLSQVTIDFGGGGLPTAGNTIIFTPPTWYGPATTYTYVAALAAPNDIAIPASTIVSMRRIQRVVNQIATVGTDYFAGSVGQSHLWAGAPTASGTVGSMFFQGRMRFPREFAIQYVEHGTVTGTITGGSVAQGGWYKPDWNGAVAYIGASGDLTIRQPRLLGNKGNRRGHGRLIGVRALSSGAAYPGDATITCWGAGYISDLAGSNVIIPRSDYFQGYGQFAPAPISLPVGQYISFGSEEGLVISKSGFLFTIGGTTPVVQLYFADE